MAVVQISKIQVRRGLNEQLPTLDSGELGWSVDTRQLYIGNGTTAEGAPVPGVTEILTEYSSGAIAADITQLQTDVANLQANVTTLQSEVGDFYLTLNDNTVAAANTAVVLQSLTTNTIDYQIVRGTTARVGCIKVSTYNSTVVYEDDYSETASTGVTFSFTSNATSATLAYTTTSTGSNAQVTYYLKAYT